MSEWMIQRFDTKKERMIHQFIFNNVRHNIYLNKLSNSAHEKTKGFPVDFDNHGAFPFHWCCH